MTVDLQSAATPKMHRHKRIERELAGRVAAGRTPVYQGTALGRADDSKRCRAGYPHGGQNPPAVGRAALGRHNRRPDRTRGMVDRPALALAFGHYPPWAGADPA